jgi:cytochrome b561
MSIDTPAHYDRRTVLYHWLSAVLVLALWSAGQTIDWFPKGTPRVTVRSLHITFGVVLLVVIVMRLAWRARGGVKLPPVAGLAGRLGQMFHRVLYALLLAVLVLGVACMLMRGDNLFNLFSLPSLTPGPANAALRHDAVDLHGLLANILLGAAGLHALAALWHQFLLKDGLLARMGRQP